VTASGGINNNYGGWSDLSTDNNKRQPIHQDHLIITSITNNNNNNNNNNNHNNRNDNQLIPTKLRAEEAKCTSGISIGQFPKHFSTPPTKSNKMPTQQEEKQDNEEVTISPVSAAIRRPHPLGCHGSCTRRRWLCDMRAAQLVHKEMSMDSGARGTKTKGLTCIGPEGVMIHSE